MPLFSVICKNSHYRFEVYHFETKTTPKHLKPLFLSNLHSVQGDSGTSSC